MYLPSRLQFNSAPFDLQGISRFEFARTENSEPGTENFSTQHAHPSTPKPTVHYNE